MILGGALFPNLVIDAKQKRSSDYEPNYKDLPRFLQIAVKSEE